jgi:hypothetical protein
MSDDAAGSRLAAAASLAVGAAATVVAMVLVDRCAAPPSSSAARRPRAAAGRGMGADVASKFGLKKHGDADDGDTDPTSGPLDGAGPSNAAPAPAARARPPAADFVPPPEESELAQEALDAWGRAASERGEAEHPLTALQKDGRFVGDVGLRLVVGVRQACLTAVVFADDQYSSSNKLHLPRLVGARPAWAQGTEEQREQEEAAAEAEARQLRRRQLHEERVAAEVKVRFNEWLVDERAENLYLDTIPQERQQDERVRLRQQVERELEQRGAAPSAEPEPEGVAKRMVADFATSVLGLAARMEVSGSGSAKERYLVLQKPPGYVSYSFMLENGS